MSKPRESQPGSESEPGSSPEKGQQGGEATFDGLREDRDISFFEKYAEEIEFSEDLKENINQHLLREADEAREKFVNVWAEKNRSRIKDEKGEDVNKLDMPAKLELFKEQGGFEELKADQQYEGQRDEIKNIDMLLYDLQKEKIPIDSQFLILNRLSYRADGVEEELKKMSKEEMEVGGAAKEEELEALFQATQEIAQKLSKDDLEENAKKFGLQGARMSLKQPRGTTKEDYIEKECDEKWKQYLSEEQRFAFEKGTPEERHLELLGYKRERKGFLRKKIIIKNKEGDVVGSFKKPEDATQFLETKGRDEIRRIDEEVRARIGQRWEEVCAAKTKEALRKQVKKIACSPENAVSGVEFVYQKARQRLIKEFQEKRTRRETRDRKKIKGGLRGDEGKIENKEAWRGSSEQEFIKGLVEEGGMLEELEGFLEKDEGRIIKFLKKHNVPTEHLEPVIKEMEAREVIYEGRKGFGLIKFLIELADLLREAYEAKPARTKKNKKNNQTI